MKVKDSCSMQSSKYHKVKLRTASGGSLTIRYRRRQSDLTSDYCSGASGSSASDTEIAEVSSCTSGGSDASNYITGNMNDENQPFDDLTDLPEYSQINSCASGVHNVDPCDILYDYGIQSAGFDSSFLWPSEHECNSSDIGSNEVLLELPAESCMDIHSIDPITMNESLFEGTEKSDAQEVIPEILQHFSFERSTMLSQHLKVDADGMEVSSTLLCMEAFEEFGTSCWSNNPADQSIIIDESCIDMQSSHMNVSCFPSTLTEEMDSSEVELIDVPSLLYDETEGFLDRTLQQHESMFYIKTHTRCMEVNSSKEDGELFDERNFLDPGMPDEVNFENSGMLQGPWGSFLNNTLQGTVAGAAPPTSIAMKDLMHVKENAADRWPSNIQSACRADESLRHAPSGPDSSGQGHSLLSVLDPIAAYKGKNIRKKRLRRATPLNTLKSLLSITEEIPAVSDVEIGCNIDNCRSPGLISRNASRRRAKGFVDSNLAENSKNTCGTSAFRSIDEIHDAHRLYQKQTCRLNSKEHDRDLQFNPDQRALNYVSSPRSRTRRGADHHVRRRPDAPRRAPRCSSLLPEHAVSTLRKWFDDHIAFPFADKEEKLTLVSLTGLTLTQVDNWLSNYRHRLKVRKSDYDGTVFRPDKAGNRH